MPERQPDSQRSTAPDRSLIVALNAGPVLLDGGLATELAAAGHDLTDQLWSARLLADAPDAIVAAHLAHLRAGASVITTASYQATAVGFARRGIDPAGTARLLHRSVVLARQSIRQARDEGISRPLWVAASVGPYGAMLADGSEYQGRYGLGVAELVRFHRDRMAVLAAAGPDVLALETVPDTVEAEALISALDGLGVPAWLSYTVDRGMTRAGQSLADAFGLARAVESIIAVGVNCCAPQEVADAVRIAAATTGKLVVAYPNSGERWDAGARDWRGQSTISGPVVDGWIRDGARLVGGCCRITPAQLADIGARLR